MPRGAPSAGELLVELGVEELPASIVERAARQLADLLETGLKEARLAADGRTVWFTPRRMIVALAGVPARQTDLVETVLGPPRSVAFDAAGEPTRAAHAFAAKHGVALAEVAVAETPKGAYLTLQRRTAGESAPDVLASLIPQAIGRIEFPKTMIWTADKFRFARPLRWIVALYAGRVVRFSVADVAASNRTSGHRAIGKSSITVSSAASLREALERNGVVVDPGERRRRIEEGLAREARSSGGAVVRDDALLEMVVNLNECPTVIRGGFDPRYLELPREILVTVLREHQKYFSLEDGSGGLLPEFLAVINIDDDRKGAIREGHERVLRARLADAAFFWATDRRTRLADRLESLGHVLFQEKLGSYRDKTERLGALARRLADRIGLEAQSVEQAAKIAKCDLVTDMVKEFTDLQGIVGGLYARAEGYPESVWGAVYEHYLPRGTKSASPARLSGAWLGLIDRLDTVCGCFSVGLIPSGSRDPFAVRRQGNGIAKILVDHGISVSMARLVAASLETYRIEGERAASTAKALGEFFEGRLRFLLEEHGYSYDSINAALAVGSDDVLDASERVKALEQLRGEPDLLAVASNFKRVKNILAQAGGGVGDVDPGLLSDKAERSLWSVFGDIGPKVEGARGRRDYRAALQAIASMRGAVDSFFDEVLVMAEDPRVRANRLALLDNLRRLFLSVADISEMVVERKA